MADCDNTRGEKPDVQTLSHDSNARSRRQEGGKEGGEDEERQSDMGGGGELN